MYLTASREMRAQCSKADTKSGDNRIQELNMSAPKATKAAAPPALPSPVATPGEIVQTASQTAAAERQAQTFRPSTGRASTLVTRSRSASQLTTGQPRKLSRRGRTVAQPDLATVAANVSRPGLKTDLG